MAQAVDGMMSGVSANVAENPKGSEIKGRKIMHGCEVCMGSRFRGILRKPSQLSGRGIGWENLGYSGVRGASPTEAKLLVGGVELRLQGCESHIRRLLTFPH